ncbi:MAG TPA: alpha/beta fold hydrolase [Fluviicoccus sp.]|nr:alpha/beta fold hydrolase [Fluviicoccus sp.]
MPLMRLNGVDLNVEITGNGPETIVFGHGLLWSGRMFEAQIAVLANRYRCITIDWRGQGKSSAPPDGYDMDTLTEDALALIREVAGGPVHYVGLSMGGFVGMRLAIRHREWLKSLTLLETSADPEPLAKRPKYSALTAVTRVAGVRAVASSVMKVMFGKTFLKDPFRRAEREEMRRRLLENDRERIVPAIRGVFTREGVYEYLHCITTPTLIIVGDEDAATVPAKSQRMFNAIPGNRLVIIPGAGHTSTVETPGAVTAAITDFMAQLG